MTSGIDGLVSGLDTTSLINSLMKIEAGPQTQLKAKVATSQNFITALQGLNAQVASLATSATSATKPAALDLYSATSSSAGVVVTTSTGVQAGQLDLVVGKLAQNQVTVSGAVTAWPDTNFTITGTNGTVTTVTAASTSLDDVVSAVNQAGAGVTATKVAVGTAGFRLQFTATAPGAAAGFTLSGTTVPMTEIKAAQDAEITLWAGTAAEQKVTSATNTFAGILPGMSLTVSSVSATPVSITVAQDDAKISTVASDLVGSLNAIFASISTKSVVVNSTNASGAAVVSAGVFTGDTGVRDVKQKLLTAASAPINGHSPSEYGISITKSGTMEFDPAKFAAALAKDPVTVKAAVQEIATRVATAATDASDKYSGQLTTKITGQQTSVRDMGNRIDAWDLSLASRRATLQSTYTALETQLSAMKAQSTWLSAQVAGLSSSTSTG
ncbi:flagellar hook-associated protein 2 [Cryobacterium sp. MP_M5]|uniref:flagellar filament capping protein FliD n=1 Tax=unclassified Cryobacterium TaxID=2649013 RepID=UPI0018CBDBB4|nr:MULTISPECIES: flagellar filament capping protein FliD [unclassified Cryobacterium]MBG6058443.1 flagellar hook-associated protein 2 [Cryobacterium sp. MP_M3]MEC5176905.1 flagellar hook-associated protein 2 [Cryobacterium sp. MP_M5]